MLSTIGPTYCADRPVMLGPVQKIGGGAKQLGINKKDFTISHESGYRLITFNKAPLADGNFASNAYEFGELEKKLAAPDHLIKVDKVYFTSSCFIFVTIFLMNIVSYQVTTGIEGSVYTGNLTDKSDDSDNVIRALGGNPW